MKTVIITGASRGIGLATANKFLENGWNVIGTFHTNRIPIENSSLRAVRMDIASSVDIARAVAEMRTSISHIDVLVNNAGINLDQKDVVADAEKIRKILAVNVVGLIGFTEALLPYMSSGSSIINVDSNYGAFSTPIDDETCSGYRISKAALNMYTRELAFRLQSRGIIVSSIDPGWCKTDMGYGVSSETEKPDREPEEAAADIYNLAVANSESGFFWKFGKKREW